METELIQIENKIVEIRGSRVMLDSDLAELYGVPTHRLNEQVKRNNDRFPLDFRFQLTQDEYDSLSSQIASSKKKRGGRRYLPYVFTEHGAVMLANVLNSPTAVQTSILIVRAFIRLRQAVISHADLSNKIEALETKYDEQFRVVFQAIRQLMNPPEPTKRKIGFIDE